MAIDPAVVHNIAEKVKAEVLTPRPVAPVRLDPSLVQKIAQKVPIFAGMTPSCLLATLATGEHFTIDAGVAVFHEGDLGNSFYVVLAGDVVVEKRRGDRTVELARLGPGECFGEMALVGNDVRSATVRAVDSLVAMRFYRDLIDNQPESASAIYRNIARVLAARLGESSTALAQLKEPRG
jgi:CRP/FNR family transcriptional regulator, cyclic AMP receptor protein